MQNALPKTASNPDSVSRLRYERERCARLEAERLLEIKSRELFEANRILEQTLQKERRLAELQMEFVNAISHEFRTPLTIIHGAAGRISKLTNCENSDSIHKKCESIQSAIQRLTRLIDRCLSVTEYLPRTKHD